MSEFSEFSEWLDGKIAQIEKALSNLEKCPEYYSLYDVLDGQLKLAKTIKSRLDALEEKR